MSGLRLKLQADGLDLIDVDVLMFLTQLSFQGVPGYHFKEGTHLRVIASHDVKKGGMTIVGEYLITRVMDRDD